MADLLLFQNVAPVVAPFPQRRPRTYHTYDNWVNFSDEELRARYRFGRESINFILSLIEDDLKRKTKRSHAIPPVTQLLIALRFYASGSFLQVIGDSEGADKSTVSRAVHTVSNYADQKNKPRTHPEGRVPERKAFGARKHQGGFKIDNKKGGELLP